MDQRPQGQKAANVVWVEQADTRAIGCSLVSSAQEIYDWITMRFESNSKSGRKIGQF